METPTPAPTPKPEPKTPPKKIDFPYPAGVELIKKWEGLELTAYPDPASGGDPWTIGYGTTKGVKKGMKITKEEAERLLMEDLNTVYLPDLKSSLGAATFNSLNTNQVSALLSFIYNLGKTNFHSSTLRKKLILGDFQGAADQFPRWNRAAGKVMKGLTNRRNDERALFLK